jgi:hypothetical protein
MNSPQALKGTDMAIGSKHMAVSGIVLCAGLWSNPVLADCTVQIQPGSLPATSFAPIISKAAGSAREPGIAVPQGHVSIERSPDVDVDALLPAHITSSLVKTERSVDTTARARFPAAIERASDSAAFPGYPIGTDRHGAKLTAQVEQAAKRNQESNAPIRCARETGI